MTERAEQEISFSFLYWFRQFRFQFSFGKLVSDFFIYVYAWAKP